uniref:Uncharacterized protein n=1 Tax=Fundulus heteroclitus TaxID=8078 RepID=A0A3Q2Q1G2_FUNHE
MDALSIVVDEVALEGLDGITIPSLWIRLQDRKPEFPLKLDDYTKGFIWRSLASNVDLTENKFRCNVCFNDNNDDITITIRYGRTLVVVASQSLRFRTLIGSENDPELKLSNESYCVLERVGRGRWQGEIQNACKLMHYLRKSLVKHELITMQSYVRRLKTGYQQHSILLLLKRFHFNRSVWFLFCTFIYFFVT